MRIKMPNRFLPNCWSSVMSIALVLSNVPSTMASDYTLNQLGLDIDGEGLYDQSGFSTALSNDGRTVAIGAQYNDGKNGVDSGHARVYKWDGASWGQIGQDLDGEHANDRDGYSIDLSSDGKIVAVAAHTNDDAATNGGQVRVFQYNEVGDIWEQMGADLEGDVAEDWFGFNLEISGDGMTLAAAGARNAGVYRYNGTSWNIFGEFLNLVHWRTSSRLSLSSDGSVLAIGEPGGSIKVYEYDGDSWEQLGSTITFPLIGHTISLSSDGRVIAAGAYKYDGFKGAVYAFQYDGTQWIAKGSPILGQILGDSLGFDLEISSSGDRIVAGSWRISNAGGRVELYEYDGNDDSWIQLGEDIESEVPPPTISQIGFAVALSGNGKVLASGAPSNEGVNGTATGHVRVYEVVNTATPEGSGDPHFKTWTGETYDFHGLCDLVLLKNQDFKNGLGMDIHIRTKKMMQWSYISNVVVRIGEDILEIMGGANGDSVSFWINGVEGDEKDLASNAVLQHSVSGFPIFYRQANSKQHEFTVDLGEDEKILVKTWKELLRVDVHGATEANFGDGLGLMGTFSKGLHMGRDGTTVLTDINDFGQEWQVLASEPTLFHLREGPQAPEKCAAPSSAKLRRRLGENTVSQEQALIACARVDEADRDMCVFDVMATSDLEVAGAY